MIPTIGELMECYPKIALAERAKSGRPGTLTVLNTLKGTRRTLEVSGLDKDAPANAFTRKIIDKALGGFLAEGVQRLTAWSYVYQTRALFARWALPYYQDKGWKVSPPQMPVFRATAPRYVRPPDEMLKSVRAWYCGLDGELWFIATMMLEFAMRNGDVLRLSDDNFVAKNTPDGCVHYLSYVPHKTELSSGRRVFWPVHPDIWSRFDEMGGFKGMEYSDDTFDEMNRQLRSLGFRGSKASYELRKICIDHVYQKFGAEMASSISGDDIKTIIYYYADPAQPNIGSVRVIDLL